jgi:hypothetical protein
MPHQVMSVLVFASLVSMVSLTPVRQTWSGGTNWSFISRFLSLPSHAFQQCPMTIVLTGGPLRRGLLSLCSVIYWAGLPRLALLPGERPWGEVSLLLWHCLVEGM